MNFAATGGKGAGRIVNVFKHGIAVGRRRHISFQADDAAATGCVVGINDDTGGIFDALNHRPRNLARAAAGAVGHDHGHGPFRKPARFGHAVG